MQGRPRTSGATAAGGPAIEARIQLRPVPASVGIARRFAGTTLDSWGCSQILEVTTLLVSEVVTNAILHARSDVEVHLRAGGHFIRVEVSDASLVVPVVRKYSTDAMTGRGLALVEKLATAWGVLERADGKTVWFEVAS